MFERRLKIFLGILSAMVLLLLGRAAQLQVAQGEEWRKEANDTLKKVSYVETSRGSIFDRTGRELARDRACTDACVWYAALTPQADPAWLSKVAISRLRVRGWDTYLKGNKAQRQEMLKTESNAIQAEIDAMWGKLAKISGSPLDRVESARQSIIQRVEMRKKYIWYKSYQRATKTPGGTSEAEPRWQRWLNGQTDDAPEIDKFVVTVGEEKQSHVVLHDISLDVQNELSRHPEQYPGLVLRPGQTRFYPFGDVACHILGHIGKVTAAELLNDPNRDDMRRKYFPNDDIGRSGLEALCEPGLRGVQGSVTNSNGTEETEPPIPGKDLRATIDVGLQQDIQKFFANATLRVKKTDSDGNSFTEEVPNQVLYGAAVLIDVKTNQVLSLVSYPTFDLNAPEDVIAALGEDEINAPTRNRATESQYEPGSTVKPLVGLAGITAGVVKVTEGIECKGFLELPDRRSGKPIKYGHMGRCWVASTYAEILKGDVAHHQVPWKAPHHGQFGNLDGFLTYADGLERSCNVYFETVADRLGIDGLTDWMGRFGLGRRTGIGIHEFKGRVPASAPPSFGVQRRTIGFLGGIGQMYVAATPIQMANVASTIARGGIWMRPRLVMPDPGTGQDPAMAAPDANLGPDTVDLHLDPEALKACRLGMYNVVNSAGGTGTTAHMDDLSVAGKTGTAQASPFRVAMRDPVTHKVMRDADGKAMYQTFEPSTLEKPNAQLPWYRGTTGVDHPIIDHSWMIGFAPADHPKIAYCVLVEYGGSGGGAAADVVRMALESCINHGYLTRDTAAPSTQPAEK